MKYFLHDSSAFQDEKITELYMNFGYEGIGLFFTTLEKLALQEKPVKTAVLKKQLHVGKKLEKCWKFMESLDILSSTNGETFNKQLLKFSEKYQIKSEKNRKRIANWRSNNKKEETVTCYESVRNTRKDKISKVKISKSNIATDVAKESPFDFSQYLNTLAEDKNRHVQLIGYYFKERKVSFPTKKAVSTEIGRWSKDAKALLEYPEDKIVKAFRVAKEKYPEEWRLSTVLKEITLIK